MLTRGGGAVSAPGGGAVFDHPAGRLAEVEGVGPAHALALGPELVAGGVGRGRGVSRSFVGLEAVAEQSGDVGGGVEAGDAGHDWRKAPAGRPGLTGREANG